MFIKLVLTFFEVVEALKERVPHNFEDLANAVIRSDSTYLPRSHSILLATVLAAEIH